jgi:Dimerisation domain/O-methyltransferase domain
MIQRSPAGSLLSPDPLLQDVLALWSSRALAAGLRLGVFAELALGPRTAFRLAAALGLAPAPARDLLDALLALGWLQRDGDDDEAMYLGTRVAAHYLDPRCHGHLGELLLAARAPWAGPRDDALDDALRAPDRAAGCATGLDPQAWEPARQPMRQGLGRLHGEWLAERFAPAEPPGSVIDLGGDGARLACAWAAQAGPGSRVTSLHAPPALPAAQAHVEACGLAARVQVRATDRSAQADLPQADLVLLSLLLQPGDAAWRQHGLHQAAGRLGPGGRLLVIEHLADDARRHHAQALVFGLAGRMTGLGRGATPEGELRADCLACGLQAGEVQPLPGGASVLVALRSH